MGKEVGYSYSVLTFLLWRSSRFLALSYLLQNYIVFLKGDEYVLFSAEKMPLLSISKQIRFFIMFFKSRDVNMFCRPNQPASKQNTDEQARNTVTKPIEMISKTGEQLLPRTGKSGGQHFASQPRRS